MLVSLRDMRHEKSSPLITRGKRMNRITTPGLALGLALAMAGTAQAQVKFGLGAPITGPSAATGAQMKNGIDQAATDINAAGGILGQKITVSYGDDVSDPKQ